MIDLNVLCRWFERTKRVFPWRENPSFYSVWVSEVMLQQTQAAVVLPYFERWMKKFPTLSHLAAASEEEVIKEWEGLGYYSRVRNLHVGAQMLAPLGEEEILKDRSLLLKIKGLGPYTRGAIRSFAWREKAAAVDGNVTRVISRFFLIEEDVGKGRVKQSIEEIVDALLPNNEPWVVMEALIELGALVCQKVPKCAECPLKEGCRGYGSGLAPSLPTKGKRVKTIRLTRHVLLLVAGEEILVQKTKPGRVMAGLYEFPFFEKGSEEEYLAHLGVRGALIKRLPVVKQTFTRYLATLYPALYRVEKKGVQRDYEWLPIAALSTVPFSSGHRKIIDSLRSIKERDRQPQDVDRRS